MKAIPAHSKAKEIFEEFASICTVSLQSIELSENLGSSTSQFKNCMKFLNAAALTNCWVHYEHICRLTYTEFRAFVKELQMVQQQFIISELANETENSSDNDQSLVGGRLETPGDDESERPTESMLQKVFNGKGEQTEDLDVPYSRGFNANKVSFAIFGTFRDQFVIEGSKSYRQYVAACQSGFRVTGMIKPDNSAVLVTLLSCEGFRENAKDLRNMVFYFIKLFEEGSGLKLSPSYLDLWSICKLARVIASKYLDEDFQPKMLDFSRKVPENADKDNIIKRRTTKGYTMFEQELKEHQNKIKKAIEEYSIEEAMEAFSKSKLKSQFLLAHNDPNIDAEEKFENCLSEAKERCKEWKEDKLDDYNELAFDKAKQEDGDKEDKLFEPEPQDTSSKRRQYLQILNREMKKDFFGNNMVEKGKVIALMESIDHSKGIVVAGPRCSGKTTLLKYFGKLLKETDSNTEMKISILNPDVYPLEKLYGCAESGVLNPEISTNKDVRISSITSSVLKIALKGFEDLEHFKEVEHENEEMERPIEVSSEESEHNQEVEQRPKLLKTLMFESRSINPLWSDCLVEYIRESNSLNNLYSSQSENNFENSEMKKTIGLTFPNGATTKLPKDILMMFE